MKMEITYHDEIKHPVIHDDHVITIYGEMQSFGLQLHGYVHHWTHNSKKHIFELLSEIGSASEFPVYVMAGNDKLKKFCRMFGFVSVDEVYSREDRYIGDLMYLMGSGLKENGGLL